VLFIFFATDVLLEHPKIDKITGTVELIDTFFIITISTTIYFGSSIQDLVLKNPLIFLKNK
uniref:hypothetical protein n=1 Tax=Acinetobacter ursingii TaxID=108980 RepID=UPI001C08D54F